MLSEQITILVLLLSVVIVNYRRELYGTKRDVSKKIQQKHRRKKWRLILEAKTKRIDVKIQKNVVCRFDANQFNEDLCVKIHNKIMFKIVESEENPPKI